jgi:hypothetical protein
MGADNLYLMSTSCPRDVKDHWSRKEYVRRVTARPRITFSLPVTEHPQVEIVWNFQNYTTTKPNFATKATR